MSGERTIKATFQLDGWPKCCDGPTGLIGLLTKNKPLIFRCDHCDSEYAVKWTLTHTEKTDE